MLSAAGVELTELSTHLQGQLVAVHPAYDAAFDGFAAPEVRGNPAARQEWAVNQLQLAAKASRNLGLKAHVTFSGGLAWPFVYPWPQRPAGLVETAFDELARRWTPILNAFDEAGVDVCYEIHPGEDLHDGITYEMFLERVNNHPRCNILYDPSHFLLQQLDYLQFIDIYHQRIRMFHAKDAEFNPSGTAGRIFRIPTLGESRRPFPVAGRWPCGFRRDLFQTVAVRVRRLGGAGMGVLHQGQRARCGGGCTVHRGAHHKGCRPRLRRLRRQRRRPGGQPQTAGAGSMSARRIRLGMVGGGQGAFIGAVHRIAARLDDQYELVAGALSSDPARAHNSAAELHIEPGRSYARLRGDGGARGGAA